MSNPNATILIVEDNLLNLKLFKDVLEAHNYTTLSTQHGNEALSLALEYRPDLILLDIQLPDISGLSVAVALKQNSMLRSIPIVAVTAFAMKLDQEKVFASGCEAYMSKPISIGHLVSTVGRLIR
jgi:two-component system cell cycle response regulator DivK